MPSYKTAFPSRWLKADDCHPPLILEVKSVGFEDIGSGTNVERKLVLHFVEREQGWVLNKTNGDLLENILGTDDYDEWIGARICLGSTKVHFQNKLVDAIRVQPVPTRKSRPPAKRSTTPAATPPAETDDTEIEF